jgi:AraC-like DNA-binding protein
MIISFSELVIDAYGHLPECSVYLDRSFPNFYALNYAHSGRIKWALNGGRSVILAAPVAWWTLKGTTPRYRYGNFEGETWDHYYVTLNGRRAARLFRDYLGAGRTKSHYTPISDPASFCGRWERLFDFCRSGDKAWAAHELEGIALDIIRPVVPPPDSPLSSSLDRLSKTIRNQPGREWLWEEEARRLNMSLVHLRRRFRERTGIPPHRFLLRARVESASQLLRATTKPIKEIAVTVGLPDVFHFSKQFKAHFHFSPASYRAEMRNLYAMQRNPTEEP